MSVLFSDGSYIVDFTPDNISDFGVCGYKDVGKHVELRRKLDWFREFYPKGLRISGVFSSDGKYQGMIEFVPGEFAHRPVRADGYMFVHCLFVGFNREYKGKGLGSLLLGVCIGEAKSKGMKGVAVVVRRGSFMADSRLFLKHGFVEVDKAKPDFSLLVLKFDSSFLDPSFFINDVSKDEGYNRGLVIFRSFQCPYCEKNVSAMVKSARDLFGMDVRVVDMVSLGDVRGCPSAFGSFAIVYNGRVVSYHPVSNTRFVSIMRGLLGG